ncbi:hypothetical protein CAPTEDRAFT_169880 [Capitella teleta]|uniref:TRASH domain-containing protein n=1 Tax=Capitella teleta TaxID=283909 RepID=R7U2J0_CAPTE|nr:hypothetical protein CAPTEDRAFT_169880 [Capitella teleta]|eukprot:ELU00215.1 hypothetical protein CAPTEDRAFT_169880 [Capitella teleta]
MKKLCSTSCLTAYIATNQLTISNCAACSKSCGRPGCQPQTIQFEGSAKTFCSDGCLENFKQLHAKMRACAWCASVKRNFDMIERVDANSEHQLFCSLNCLSLYRVNLQATSNQSVFCDQCKKKSPAQYHLTMSDASAKTKTVEQKIIVQPPPAKAQKNKALLCKPFVQTKATSCKPHMETVETQTDEWKPPQVLIPVPVPIYVPVPVHMFTTPAPFPLPIPIPLPVPCFIPTTKKSTSSILKHVKEIQERIPTDPFEAEMLMMAERLVEQNEGSSSDEDEEVEASSEAPPQPPAPSQQANDLGEDMLQIAMRMASEMPDEALDVEDSVAPTPIQPDGSNSQAFATIDENSDILSANRDVNGVKGRKRGRRASKGSQKATKRSKGEGKASSEAADSGPPDANMVLKYTYGVNAWKHWVVQKNLQIEKTEPSQRPRFKPFKLDVMQCTADELNYSLCLFVKEVRKPNGEEYAPDSIFYLCLGIQQYLLENGRIDNIFSDTYYEGFTDHLNEILARYEVRLNSSGLIVCRIEEEHLWEAKQLGAHSPHVLLNTLIYFNTKYFMLKTPDEHLRLSFSHIMKHWKKTTATGTKTPGRAVYLRYYAPSGNPAVDAKKKKEETPVQQEQGENTENPLRCPVKLYEFYLSKCPESIKNRNDVFYLIPERSCVPDSPVWYSTGCLGLEAMTKMLNRLRVVREIQEAHLHYSPY